MAARTKKRNAAGPERRRWLFGKKDAAGVQRPTRWQSLGIIVVVSLATVAAGCLGLRQVWLYVVNLDEFRVYPGQIRLEKLPWLDREAMRRALVSADKTGFLRTSHSILARNLTTDVARAYEQSPWVRRVQSVRKRFPSRLYIELDLRRPYARLECRGRSYLADEEGVVLDEAIYHEPAGGLATLPVEMEYADRPPEVGRSWQDPRARMALDMLHYAASQPSAFARLGVERIEVRREGGLLARKSDLLVLKTRFGTDIRWGGSPAGESALEGEPSATDKLRALELVLQQRGGDLGGLECIDVRWHSPAITPRT